MDRATAAAFARPRSKLRWLDAATTLQDFALVTFDVDPGRLAAEPHSVLLQRAVDFDVLLPLAEPEIVSAARRTWMHALARNPRPRLSAE